MGIMSLSDIVRDLLVLDRASAGVVYTTHGHPLHPGRWFRRRSLRLTPQSGSMMATKAVVIGGGLIGLSVARALTARGLTDVVVLERHQLASGGTGKSSGIVRTHYGVPSIAAMAWRSLPLFEQLGAEVGFRQTGYCVLVGPENVEALKANTAMHQKPRGGRAAHRQGPVAGVVADAERRGCSSRLV